MIQTETPPKTTKAKKPSKSSKMTKDTKDSNKPIRAPSAYIMFSKKKHPELKLAHPNATFGEIGRMIGAAWKDLSDDEKTVRPHCTLICHTSIVLLYLLNVHVLVGLRGGGSSPCSVTACRVGARHSTNYAVLVH